MATQEQRDVRDVVGFALAGGIGARPGPIYVWGFCKGGRFAHYAGAFDTRLAGVLNFYGRLNFLLSETKPFAPRAVTGLIACPYLGVFAGDDPYIPREEVEALRAGLAARDIRHHVRLYEEAHHGFCNADRLAHHPAAAADAFALAQRFILTGALP